MDFKNMCEYWRSVLAFYSGLPGYNKFHKMLKELNIPVLGSRDIVQKNHIVRQEYLILDSSGLTYTIYLSNEDNSLSYLY